MVYCSVTYRAVVWVYHLHGASHCVVYHGFLGHSVLTSLAPDLPFLPGVLHSHLAARVPQTHEVEGDDNEFDQFRKRMMLSYRFRPNPMVRRTQR